MLHALAGLFLAALFVLHTLAPYAACICAGVLFVTIRRYFALNPCCSGSEPRRMRIIGKMLTSAILLVLFIAEILLTR